MMKMTLLAAALLMSGAAIAQTTTTTTTTEPDVDLDVGVQPDGDLDVDADVDTETRTVTTTPYGATHDQMHLASLADDRIAEASNADPEHDARGIAVISDPAIVPAGYNGVPGTAMGGPLVDPVTGETIVGENEDYPPCTASVTDNCIQLYERGVRDD